MKTFKNLKFEPHRTGLGGKSAVMNFDNGYGVSVLIGDHFYSNGVDTYELAVLKNGSLTYETPITDDVLGYLSKAEITETMKLVQELPNVQNVKEPV